MPIVAVVLPALKWVATAGVLAVPLASPGGPLAQAMPLERPTVTITGSVSGLQAEVPARLTLTVHSTASQQLVVNQLSARVTGASAGCDARALEIDDWNGSLEVPAGGASAVVLRTVLHGSPGVCAGATWQLAYTSR